MIISFTLQNISTVKKTLQDKAKWNYEMVQLQNYKVAQNNYKVAQKLKNGT